MGKAGGRLLDNPWEELLEGGRHREASWWACLRLMETVVVLPPPGPCVVPLIVTVALLNLRAPAFLLYS